MMGFVWIACRQADIGEQMVAAQADLADAQKEHQKLDGIEGNFVPVDPAIIEKQLNILDRLDQVRVLRVVCVRQRSDA